MAKKQTRRSISVSRTTYERLKSFCETNNISMSQLVETRVNDFLGEGGAPAVSQELGRAAAAPRVTVHAPTTSHAMHASHAAHPSYSSPASASAPMVASALAASMSPAPAPRSAMPSSPAPSLGAARVVESRPAPSAGPAVVPMTSAAARYAVEPPPPIIKPRQETAAPKPAEKRPDQIFTF